MGAHAPIATYGSEVEPQETQVGTSRRRIRHVRWDSPRFPLAFPLFVPGYSTLGAGSATQLLVAGAVRQVQGWFKIGFEIWLRRFCGSNGPGNACDPSGVANLSLCPGSTTLI